MGNTQYCCNYKDKDPHGQEYSNTMIQKDKKMSLSQRQKSKGLDLVLDHARKNTDSIIKLQALFRGYLQRKVNKIANDFVDPKPQLSHRSRGKAAGGKSMENKGKLVLKGNSYARELKEMPDHSNEATR